jgi:phosphonate utilization associated putative membrane protein
MTLTWPVVGVVLCAALLHASWNAMIKSGGDKAADTALVTLGGAVLALPALVWVGLPQRSVLPFVLASTAVHVGYYVALAGAYRHGEFGVTYPIMRGFAPLLVALGSQLFIGERPSTAAWLGIIGIATGVGMVGLAHPGEALHRRRAMQFAFANAGLIAVYTTLDGLGVRHQGEAGAAPYVLLLYVLDAPFYPALVWWRRSAAERQTLRAYARKRWPMALMGGGASIGAYGIALWAMTRAPVASVAALRETSVLFAAVLGTVVLKERFGWQRALGTGVIAGGVMALRFG